MHPRMSGTGIKSYYKCDNEHNFTKEGELVNLFGKPLKKEYIKPELEGLNAKELEGVNAEELEQRESIWYLKDSETPYSGKAFRWGDEYLSHWQWNLRDGKQDGLWVSWHEKGQKESEANWKNGELVEGSQKWWDNKGNPIDSEKEAVDEVVTQALQKQQLAAKNPDETLYDATLLGETEKVKKAITEGADVNTKGALHNAVVASLDSGDNEIVEMFISNGANVNAKDDEGLTALDIIKSLSDIAAVSKNLRAAIGKTDGDIPVADLLRKHGAKTSEELKANKE